MFESIKNFFRTKSYISGMFYNGGLGTGFEKRQFKQLVEEAYKINPTVYACVNEISTAVAGIPWKVYRKGRGTASTPKEILSGPLVDLIKRPNTEDSFSGLNECDMADYLLAGNSYMLLVGPKGFLEKLEEPLKTAPVGLWNIQPGSVEAIYDKSTGLLVAWNMQTLNGSKRQVHPSRILHRKTYNPLDRTFGMSPLEAAARDVDTMNESLRYNYGLLKNGGSPAGLILIKGTMDPRSKKEAQAQIDGTFNNPDAANRWKMIEGADGADIKQLAMSNKDMEFGSGRIANAIGICTVFNVPPEIIGIQGQKTYSNYQEARRAFYQECILPHLDRKEERFNHSLVPLFGNEFELRYDKDQIEALQEDRDKKATRSREDFKAGLITANEARADTGRDPADDELADERMIGLGQTPVADYMASTAEPPVDPSMDPAMDSEDPMDEEGTDPEETDGEDPAEPSKKKSRLTTKSKVALYMTKGADPRMAFKSFQRRRNAWLRKAGKIMNEALSACYVEAAKNVRLLDGSQGEAPMRHQVEAAIDRAVRNSEPLWRQAYAQVYTSVGMDFAEAVDKGLTEAYGKAAGRDLEVKAGERQAWEAFIERYLRAQGGKRIQDIMSTTRKRITNSLADSYAKGEGADTMADKIMASEKFTAGRSLVIARTEVVSASNMGSQAAAESFGIPLKKAWLSTEDGRERETHAAADGQTVGINETFEVGGSRLLFPGDSSMGAEAGEVCNCRCTQTYEPA